MTFYCTSDRPAGQAKPVSLGTGRIPMLAAGAGGAAEQQELLDALSSSTCVETMVAEAHTGP